MKKHLKTMLVACLLVPCLILFAACGGDASQERYKLSTVKMVSGGVTASIDFSDEETIASMLEGYGMEEQAETVIDMINSLKLVVTDSEVQIRVNMNGIMQAAFAIMESAMDEDDDAELPPFDIEEILEVMPAMDIALILKYKMDGNNFVFLNADGDSIELPEGVTIKSSGSKITLKLSGDLMATLPMEEISVTFAKVS